MTKVTDLSVDSIPLRETSFPARTTHPPLAAEANWKYSHHTNEGMTSSKPQMTSSPICKATVCKDQGMWCNSPACHSRCPVGGVHNGRFLYHRLAHLLHRQSSDHLRLWWPCTLQPSMLMLEYPMEGYLCPHSALEPSCRWPEGMGKRDIQSSLVLINSLVGCTVNM